MKKFSGYIEGYYGRLLSWGDRAQLLVALEKLGLNTYVYGPKEDVFHRVQWKNAYPREWTAQFTRFVKDGKKRKIRVVPALSPGLSYDYCSTADYSAVERKFRSFIACGAETVALFMDDIPENLPKNCRRSFSSLGHAHAALLSRLQNDLRKSNPAVSVWFCPTVYCDRFAKGAVRKNQYLLDLSAGIPRDSAVFWTGPSVISESIGEKDIAPVSGLFSGNIIIWDNLYANDYCPHRLFTGPYRGRSAAMIASAKGICLNPTGLMHTDMMLLGRLSELLNKKRPAAASRYAADALSPPDSFEAVSRFFDLPFARAPEAGFVSRNCAAYQKALKHLIWRWKSPLQREWYPYLFMLDRDLALAQRLREKTASRGWIDKYYSPVLSPLLACCLAKKRKIT